MAFVAALVALGFEAGQGGLRLGDGVSEWAREAGQVERVAPEAGLLVEDGVFDRGDAPHRLNLFDMHAKYADILTTDDVLAYLATLPSTAAGVRG